MLVGWAEPIVIFIINVISYYPPPCFSVAKPKVPGVQAGLDAKMPFRRDGTIYHLAMIKPPSIWKAEFAG